MKTRAMPFVLAVIAGGVASADVKPHAGMLRYPDVSATHIVFSYANDLWIVSKGGGVALPLASPPGAETFPRFSPDGKTIAFVGNYDGNRDLYTIGATGGTPTRVSHHPGGESLSDWTPDGKSLQFQTSALAGLARQQQGFTIPAGGGMYEKLPVPYSGFGAISPSGEWLAYTPHSVDTRTWKRYRGGMATDVWLFNLKDKSAKKITEWEGVDTLPMWVPGMGEVVYYLSDNGSDHRMNIWSYKLASGQREQVTFYKDDDIKWPSVGPGSDGKGEIVFQLGSSLLLLDLGTKQAKAVEVVIPGDRPQIRAKSIDASKYLRGATISPGAKRVVIEGRGELFSAPVKEGVIRNITRSDGFAERDPSWSPDGKWIAYLSDVSGDYELWVRPSDAKPPEEKKDEKKEGEAKKDEPQKDDAKAGDAKADDAKSEPDKKPEPKPEPRKLTSFGPGFRYNPSWSPDSTMIACSDSAGRMYIITLASGESKQIDKDEWTGPVDVSWSGDSKWVAYVRTDDRSSAGVIWITDAKTGERHQITSGMFTVGSVAFDRKGDWLFYSAASAVNNPEYSDLDTAYAYRESSVLNMVPLRKGIKSPWLAKNDEETLKKDDAKKDDAKKDEGKKDEKPDDTKEKPVTDDGVSGTWKGSVKGPVPELAAGLVITINLTLSADGSLTGSLVSVLGSGTLSGKFTKSTGEVTFTVTANGMPFAFTGTITGMDAKGTWSGDNIKGDWDAKRSSSGGGGAGTESKKDEKKDEGAGEKPKEVKIDFEGMERRTILLPVPAGDFGALGVADGEKLLFTRRSQRHSGGGVGVGGLKIFDYKADEPKEEAVTGGGGWQLTPDGKKVLVVRAGGLTVVDASSGGGKAQSVTTAGMTMQVDPRTEWKQIFTDAWRIMRDHFYEPTMHGVDWAGVRAHYGAMLDDAATREDVNFIIAEMISELNIGHAYLQGQGDVEDQPTVGVGLVGCDLALDAGAYRITRIFEGGPWDADARGPLSQPGIDAKVGDYLLSVNGVPLDTSKDPWAGFVGQSGKTVSLTLNALPTLDGKEREVVVKALGSETELRYRAYIEAKRAYVGEKTEGRVGYIYVPNTGVDGQNDLYRQFFGQRGREALIIDERWNGGGQIPTRFIELLNRKPTNYWARRDSNDWPWPPDAFFGPKCMLANGLAGSGGDMFPWLFKHNKIGKVIGTRTWGGLVGISGNPQMIDGGSISVPTFGFYETDGTWGVEGHGTDPDIEVIDDPSKMPALDGTGGWVYADPQLDRAIQEMLSELKTNPYKPPARPASPTYRKGMGIQEQDK